MKYIEWSGFSVEPMGNTLVAEFILTIVKHWNNALDSV